MIKKCWLIRFLFSCFFLLHYIHRLLKNNFVAIHRLWKLQGILRAIPFKTFSTNGCPTASPEYLHCWSPCHLLSRPFAWVFREMMLTARAQFFPLRCRYYPLILVLVPRNVEPTPPPCPYTPSYSGGPQTKSLSYSTPWNEPDYNMSTTQHRKYYSR